MRQVLRQRPLRCLTASARRFNGNEDGAITVDWVVLTAAIVIVGVTAIGVISPGVYATASTIDSRVEAGLQ